MGPLFFALIFVFGSVSIEGCAQPRNYHTWNHHAHEYLFANELDDFYGAASKCRCWGGYLARVESSTESGSLRHQCSIFDDGRGDGYYIGAKADHGIVHSTFLWSEDLSTVHYFDWWQGQPNRKTQTNPACIVMWRTEHYHWNDVSCAYDRYYICERYNHEYYEMVGDAIKDPMTLLWRIACPVWIVLLYKVMCSSVFEVSILRLNNNRGVNQYGRCCAGSRTTPPCTEECQTYFSVCLMHYIQVKPTCIYGMSETTVIGGNNLFFQDSRGAHTIKMPMNFTWPGKFSMLFEAWHATVTNMSSKDPSQLIIQSLVSKTIYPSTSWRGETTITPTTELKYKYRIRCRQYFYGQGCDVMCKARNDQFGHYTCNKNGTEICNAGWTGLFCDKAICSEECLKNKGFCERPYECRCRLGWEGPHCGQCHRYNGCLHGYCYEPYQCICKGGWTGILCDVDINYCFKWTPCLNGGTCMSGLVTNYTCLCTERYGGVNCQYALCFEGYCQNDGVCRTRNLIRECTCKGDYYGNQCQFRKVLCNEITCYSGGKCLMGENGGYCQCQANSTGMFCETPINACISNPCSNGGKCKSTEQGYHCDCLPNYAGRHCSVEINPCRDSICHNGGNCVVRIGSMKPVCNCPRQFTGDKCQIPLDPCYGVTCLNGGTCAVSPMGNGFICICAGNYYGELCEESTDLCESAPCKNGAACKNYITYFVCICPRKFYGKYCERHIMLSDMTKQSTPKENLSDTDVNDSTFTPTVNSPVSSASVNFQNVMFTLCSVLITVTGNNLS